MSTPLTTQISTALVALLAGIPGVLGAAHDEPIDFDKRALPFAWVYEGEERFDTETATSHYFLSTDLHVVLAYPYSEEAGNLPRPTGQAFKALVLIALAADFQLGGVATDVLPLAAVVQDQINGLANTAALVMAFEARYHHPHADPYRLA